MTNYAKEGAMMTIEYKPLTEDDFEKMLTEQRVQLEYALAVFDAMAEFYLIDYKMKWAKIAPEKEEGDG